MGFWASIADAGKRTLQGAKNLFAGETRGRRFTAPYEALAYFRRDENWKGVSSSNVAAIGYFASVQKGVKSCLGVKFLNGNWYAYDVPIGVYTAFRAARSPGTFVWNQLRRKNVDYDGPYS